MNHLKEAKMCVGPEEYSTQLDVGLAIAHALIAIAERLPPPAETASECQARLRREESNGV